jgi:hypothetical protein
VVAESSAITPAQVAATDLDEIEILLDRLEFKG